MNPRSYFLILTLVAVLLAGVCAAESPLNVAGTWDGSISGRGKLARIIIRVEQNGEKVSGDYDTIGLRPAADKVPLEGTIIGDQLTLKKRSTGEVRIEATVADEKMNGKYYGYFGQSEFFLTAAKIK